MAPRRTTSQRAYAPEIADIAEDAWRMRLWNYAYRASGGEWTPYPALKYIANIIQATIAKGGGRLIINIPPRHGKLCADDTQVPTPSGWRTHGELEPGDQVYGPDGSPASVVAVSGRGAANMRVTFTNGEAVECHEAHEWTVYDPINNKWRTVETGWLERSGGVGVFRLPLVRGRLRGPVYIRSVERISNPKRGRCIQVDREDGLYLVGKKMVPTHNSELISRWLPTWFLDWYPHKNVILTSYGDSLAGNYGRKVRDELDGNELTWSELGNKQITTDWRTAHGGGMRTAGVGGPILGFGGDLFLMDDPYKNKAEAFRETHRKQLEEWFRSTAYSRFEPGATVILIMQRWHHEDLSGYLMNEHEDDWVQVRLPALAETDELNGITDPLGRAAGEALIPERYNAETLGKIQRATGSVFWSGMYQQRPSPEAGNIVMRDWFEYYMRYPPNISRVVVSWDMSFKKTGKSWCVGQAWYQQGSRHWLLDQVRFKAGFTEALQRMVRFHNSCTGRWGSVHQTLIEEAANGIGIIDTVKGKVPRVKGIKATVSKVERLSNAAPSIECGDVLVPDKRIATFDVEGLVDEVVAFPNGADDQCDSLSQYINKYKTQKVGQIVIPETGAGVSAWPT